ncbi:MAG: DUF423 domain-containing protein [Pseudomonadales bacterium]|nr:DUF423 domain-containing protein [Pseudomonadales bacterium]
MARYTLFIASISAFLAVAMGAFGAHALKTVLDDKMMAVYKTAVLYQFVHSLALFALAILVLLVGRSNLLLGSVASFSVGIILFSGSLYVLAISGNAFFGLLTPLGGLALLAGWLLLAVFACRLSRGSPSEN